MTLEVYQRMKKLFALVLSLVLATMSVGLVAADVAVGGVGAGAEPGDQVPRICVKHRDVIIGTDANPPGINPFDYRTSLYSFTGEQLEYYIAVRDPNGALDIGYAKIKVDGGAEVLCNPVSSWEWDYTCDGMGELDYEGDESTDKLFHCLLTTEPQWYGENEVKITVYNSANQPTDGTHVETWFFNPSLSLSVSTNDGQPIRFEPLPYGANTPEERTVHSVNRLQVRNTAEGGVNMWMFLAGTDLFDPNGASKCPTTNVLAIEPNMQYRGWTGTQWTSWEGWKYMGKYNQNDDCELNFPNATTHCYGGHPVPASENFNENNHLGQNPFDNVLTNGGLLEVEFKLTYPMPCIGTFSNGQIMVFGKAV